MDEKRGSAISHGADERVQSAPPQTRLGNKALSAPVRATDRRAHTSLLRWLMGELTDPRRASSLPGTANRNPTPTFQYAAPPADTSTPRGDGDFP